MSAQSGRTVQEDAMMEYLKVGQDLEVYGVNFFEVHNKNNSSLLLGVDALGLSIYDKNNRLNPHVGFPWSEIRHLNSHNKKFLIKPVDKKSNDFVLFSPNKKVNKKILLLAAGNHQLHKRRREDESVEIHQMRLFAKTERNAKLADRQNLYLERMQRVEAERNKMELEDKLQKYQSQYHLAIHELEKTRESNLHLNKTDPSPLDTVDGDVDQVDLLKKAEKLRERETMRRRIESMKQEIDERRKILKMILENNKLSSKRGESIKNLLNAYSAILPCEDMKINYENDNFEYTNIQERIEALASELSVVRLKTREVRKDISNIIKNQTTAAILNKHDLLRYFSDENQPFVGC